MFFTKPTDANKVPVLEAFDQLSPANLSEAASGDFLVCKIIGDKSRIFLL